MKYRGLVFWISVYSIVMLGEPTLTAYAQGEGFLRPLTQDSTSQALPPGAVHEGTRVTHVIASQENLHLLAAYYYGDPRQWQRIYRDNRTMLRYPNRLPVGQTLQISVDETWQPRVAYQEWWRLANRNGQWQPGHWKRASNAPIRRVAAPRPVVPQTTPKEPVVTPPQSAEAERAPVAPLPVEAAQPERQPVPAVPSPSAQEELPPEAPEIEQAPAF